MKFTSECCKAMRDAGIKDASSQEGINFCVHSCPYEEGCVLFDDVAIMSLQQKKIAKRTALAKRLLASGISVKDIALILHACVRTIRGDLAKK